MSETRVGELRALLQESADLFDDVWLQFAVETTVQGQKQLSDGGLSVLEEVRYWLDHHADWDLKIDAALASSGKAGTDGK